MTPDPRNHVQRRGRAIERLRSLTTAVAVAGLAGTAGFGVLAAATWSGNDTTPAAADGRVTTPTAPDDATGADPPGTDAPVQPFGTGRGSTGQAPTTTTPRVGRSGGSGHATTGGSN
jgi:hypothetical protein